MLIDCTTCVARDVACGDCVISVLLASPPPRRRHRRDEPLIDDGVDLGDTVDTTVDTVDLDAAAQVALGHLASAGLVPPLRLVAPLPSVAVDDEAARLSGNGREIA